MFGKKGKDKKNDYFASLNLEEIEANYPNEMNQINNYSKNAKLGALTSSAGQNVQNLYSNILVNQNWILIKQNEDIIKLLEQLNNK